MIKLVKGDNECTVDQWHLIYSNKLPEKKQKDGKFFGKNINIALCRKISWLIKKINHFKLYKGLFEFLFGLPLKNISQVICHRVGEKTVF